MISVIIPTYKHPEVIVKNLRHNLPYLAGCEVIVVNDDPDESIKAQLDEFIQVKLIENAANQGFSGAVNTGAQHATGEFLFLLNSDVKLLNSSFQMLCKHFETNEKLFAVTCAQKEFDGTVVGKNIIFLKNGLIQHSKAGNTEWGVTAWAEGGSSLVRKSIFDKLGGFDELYSPFYWEDLDLSYRAWKAGYEVLFDPGVLVEHHHETTISSVRSKQFIQTIAFRNQFIFQWKNISDAGILLKHGVSCVRLLLGAFLRGDTVFLEGFFQATQRFFTIIKKRSEVSRVKTDYEILEQFSQK